LDTVEQRGKVDAMPSTTVLQTVRRHGWPTLRGIAVAALLGFTAACASSTSTQTVAPGQNAAALEGRTISPATLKPGQGIPMPTQKPVLTVTGKISVTNQAGALVFDQPTIERLGMEQVRLYEPWTKQNLEFRGIWLQHLVAIAGVDAAATRLHIVALDDYTVDLTLADIRAGGIMLATRAGDGTPIPIDEGGPNRIVFMDGVKAGANADQWIWSIKTIEVQ
jgi:hypothetical protein